MIGQKSGVSFREEIDAVKAQLVIGEVAQALNLTGCSRDGWECPACGALGTLKERTDHQGARCSSAGCGAGFDAPGLVMTARGTSARGAVVFLERVIAERDAAAAAKDAPSLFGE